VACASQAFYLLVGFCLGEFTEGWALLQGQVLTLEVGGRVLRAEAVAIAIAAAWSWIRTLAGGRTYHLPDGKGGDVKVVKWDPDHGALAMSCLLSPIHAVYLLVPDVTRDAEGNNRPSIQMLLVATLHGYMSLAAAHMFLRREHAQRKINNSSYALEVDQRNLEMNRRRKAEREVRLSLTHTLTHTHTLSLSLSAFPSFLCLCLCLADC
jgi:hypothetical protein